MLTSIIPRVKQRYLFGMVLVLLTATALRLWALPDVPVGLHYDEAANVILTRQIARGDYRPHLHPRVHRQGSSLLLRSSAVDLDDGRRGVGLTPRRSDARHPHRRCDLCRDARALSAERHARTIALLAAVWMACAFPHVLLSRYGFRAISQPLLQALTVATLWRGLRTGKRRWLVAAGVFLGLTGYTYLAARLFPIPLALAHGLDAWYDHRETARRQYLTQLGLALLFAVVDRFAPLGLYFLRNPEAFTTRITQVAAPTWRDALRGLWLCVQALVRPGAAMPTSASTCLENRVLDAVSACWPVLWGFSLLFAPGNASRDCCTRQRGPPLHRRRHRYDAPSQRTGDVRNHTQQFADGRPFPFPRHPCRPMGFFRLSVSSSLACRSFQSGL